MSSGVHGSKNERGEMVHPKLAEDKTEDEKYLLKLLALVSDKIKERFVNLQ
jgi:Ca2+-binding EF-hand superfamily protein